MTDRVGTPEGRQATISRLLSARGRLDVAAVADQLGVAQETVRRDLRVLESTGLLRRVHGGAIAIEADNRIPIPSLATPPPNEAELVRRLWTELPRTGTLLVGSGPIAIALTAAIAAAPPSSTGLTIVTNSLDAAVHLARIPTLSVYNIGGTVSRQTRAQEGDWALEELGRLRVDIAILSPAGITVEHGLSEASPAAAAIAQAELACADRSLAACRSTDLGRSAFVKYADLSQIDQILVAGLPPAATVQRFRDAGANVEIVVAG